MCIVTEVNGGDTLRPCVDTTWIGAGFNSGDTLRPCVGVMRIRAEVVYGGAVAFIQPHDYSWGTQPPPPIPPTAERLHIANIDRDRHALDLSIQSEPTHKSRLAYTLYS